MAIAPLLNFSFHPDQSVGHSLDICFDMCCLEVTWSGHLLRDLRFCIAAFKALKVNTDAHKRHMLDMQSETESRPLQVSYTHLCTLTTEVVNLWPSFGILNRTMAPPPFCAIEPDSPERSKALDYLMRGLRFFWTLIYMTLTLDMFAAYVGFIMLIEHSLSCDGVYCSVTVTIMQSIPQAFFAIFMMPATIHSITGVYSRLYGIWAGVVSWLLVTWYLKNGE